METLIKQTRSRFGVSKEGRSSSTTDKKTQSFREKRSQSWMKKQVSRQMSWEYDFSSTEYPTAIAAAAHAIQSLEQSNSWDKKERDYSYDKSLSNTNSRVDETPQPLKSAHKSSDETANSSLKDEGSSSMSKRLADKKTTKKISFADMDEIRKNQAEKSPSQKAPERAPSLKRPPPFADMADSKRPGAALPKPEQRPPTTQPVQSTGSITRRPGPGDSAADAWEKEEMTSIKERYEKLRATIDNWEIKKKKKAKRKIESTEAELDKRKVKYFKKYSSEMARIEGIAGGARSLAEENRRKEELKVKETAKKIRSTGKIPPTCLCF